MAKKSPINQPRDIDNDSWYYVRRGSVDFVTSRSGIFNLTRKRLLAMLSELKPIQKKRQK